MARHRPPDYALEQAAGASDACLVAGVDEAGRGALAGPVVAAAVIIDLARMPRLLRRTIRDSKLLTARQRAMVAQQLLKYADIGVGQTSAADVDRLGIVPATLQAMTGAVAALPRPPQVALVDGVIAPWLDCDTQVVVQGDRLSLSVAAASIIAKVARDGIMAEMVRQYPGFGWEHNFGYGTPQHLVALARLGRTPEHRCTFAPLRMTTTATH
jgi:ribonuclease HII